MAEKRTIPTVPTEAWCWRFADDEDKCYHDTEWGIPVHDDRHMFEHLMLECLQCGLSWSYVLHRREIFRKCFRNFEIDKTAKLGDKDIERMLTVENMLRSPRKIRAVISNARAAQAVRDEFGTFSDYFWSWTDGKTIVYPAHQKHGLPAKNALSERIAKDLKRRGFSYVGPTNIYAHMQACGLICDHNQNCPQYAYIRENFPCVEKRREGEG